MRINDINAMLEAVRKMALMKQDGQDDLSTRTLELAQVRDAMNFEGSTPKNRRGYILQHSALTTMPLPRSSLSISLMF